MLWQQVQVLSGRNCFSTALQYAKILYQKNSVEDPLAIILFLDTIALRSKNYQFLVSFYEQFEVSLNVERSGKLCLFQQQRNLDMLPNFLYSTAYAYNCLFEKSNSEEHLQKSKELISKAYVRFPVILAQIIEQLSIDAGPSLKKENLFQTSNIDRETVGVKLLVKIYLHHSLSFWKQPERLAWLESTSSEFVSTLTPSIRSEVKGWTNR